MNFCIFDVITYSERFYTRYIYFVVIWWIFVSLMWLHTALLLSDDVVRPLWFDEFLYLWCDYIQRMVCPCHWLGCCDLMNFCIFDVITYSFDTQINGGEVVVIWWIFVSLMWLHTAYTLIYSVVQVLWFDEFLYLWCDYIQHDIFSLFPQTVVIWWIFVSLMWLHTAVTIFFMWLKMLWFDEFLYLWCDYIQQAGKYLAHRRSCDLMNFCIFDVITYSRVLSFIFARFVVIWWIFVSLMWLHTAYIRRIRRRH